MYIEIAKGDRAGNPSIRNIIVLNSDLPKYIQPKEELYRSYYSYDEAIVEHLKVYKTVSSFKGNYYLDKIILDVDKGKGTDEEVLEKTRRMVQTLEDEWKLDRNQLALWYSGTGYHISFPDIFRFEPSNFLPDEVKLTFAKYFPDMDAMPLMRTGLIRVGYSYNAKSKRYKIPLSSEELFGLTFKEIAELSKSNEPRDLPKSEEFNLPDYSGMVVKRTEKRQESISLGEPTKIVTCAQKMFLEGSKEGSGHQVMLRMISSWRKAGLPLEAVMVLTKQWASNRNEPEWSDHHIENQVKYIWEKGYTPGCEDPIRIKYCDSKCIFYKDKNYVQEVYDIKSMEKNYSRFLKSDALSKSINLNGIFRLKNDFMIYPEEVIYIIGDKGVGKTSLAQNLAVLSPLKTLYINLEFSGGLLYRRFVQIKHNMPKGEVDWHYKLHSNTLSEGLEHIYVLDVPPMIDSIRELIATVEPGLVIIDTVEDITTRAKGFEHTELIGKELKNISKSMKTIIIGILHISKSAATNKDGTPKELTIHSGKGSSAMEQKADKVLSIEGLRDNSLRLIRTLAARDEEPFQIQVEFDKSTFRMKQLSFRN